MSVTESTRICTDYETYRSVDSRGGNTVPTYHYRCKNCGYDFTEQQSFSDAPITVCPQCGQERVRKVYAAPSIEFKGSGFYRTDSGSSSK